MELDNDYYQKHIEPLISAINDTLTKSNCKFLHGMAALSIILGSRLEELDMSPKLNNILGVFTMELLERQIIKDIQESN